MSKILLASGCSFTFEPWCWPGPLSEDLNLKLLNVGMASQGNGLISRKVIYNVEKLLENYSNEDIIVGVMWSGPDRYDYHTYSSEDVKTWGSFPKDIQHIKNPTNIVDNMYNWIIINSHWENKETKMYYQYFHTPIYSMIQTVEHILRVQWYLERLNIKYFMTTYLDIFDKILISNEEVEYLYKQINFNKFLPVEGCYEWVRDNYPDKGFNNPSFSEKKGIHPTPFGHKMFSENVIIPYLKNNYNL